ncbi:hypothetical protein B0T16DRAFT_420904 [Cercophora newfieldiana]|uniref:Uncharacterized protein n=1 Tax=Cercophora newfieldiana TaxID=92897 RepID=A0AA40CK95_9PEZI|nr:hypothetical protein B0T16DRAFT_420904 [Cercophora newfieldiana]
MRNMAVCPSASVSRIPSATGRACGAAGRCLRWERVKCERRRRHHAPDHAAAQPCRVQIPIHQSAHVIAAYNARTQQEYAVIHPGYLIGMRVRIMKRESTSHRPECVERVASTALPCVLQHFQPPGPHTGDRTPETQRRAPFSMLLCRSVFTIPSHGLMKERIETLAATAGRCVALRCAEQSWMSSPVTAGHRRQDLVPRQT